MANRDIAGLLTGVPSKPISPLSSMTPDQQYMELGARAAGHMGKGVRGMLGMGPTAQEAQQQQVANLDLNNPDDLLKLSRLQRVNGNPVGAAKSAQAAQQLQKDANVRASLVKVAEAQGNTDMVEFIKAGGSLATAQSILFRAEKAHQNPTLTKDKRLEYKGYWDTLTDEQKKASGIQEKTMMHWMTGSMTDDTDKLETLFRKAEYIAANQGVSRRAAFDSILGTGGGGGGTGGGAGTTSTPPNRGRGGPPSKGVPPLDTVTTARPKT